MFNEKLDYQSYLLRLWRVSDVGTGHPGDEMPVWRVSLQSPLTRERVRFATLDDLVEFLRQEMNVMADAAAEHNDV